MHLRVKPRKGRKYVTTIEGLSEDLDKTKLIRAMKKSFQCNGNAVLHEEHGEIIMLSGDQRANVRQFLIDQEVCADIQIVMHGA